MAAPLTHTDSASPAVAEAATGDALLSPEVERVGVTAASGVEQTSAAAASADVAPETEQTDHAAASDEDISAASDASATERADVLHFQRQEEPDALDFLQKFSVRLSHTANYDDLDDEDAEDEAFVTLREDYQVVQAFCTRPSGTDCDRCAQVCPHGAISFPFGTADGAEGQLDLPVIDDELCTNCGLCAGICDGFSSVRITLENLVTKAKRQADDANRILFCCTDLVPAGTMVPQEVITLPCLAAVPPEFWCDLLLQGLDVTCCCDAALCAECPTAGPLARELYTHALATAEAWSGRAVAWRDDVPRELDLFDTIVEQAGNQTERRGMLTNLANTASDVASGERSRRMSTAVAELHESRERMRAQGHIRQHEGIGLASLVNLEPTKVMWPRRSLLQEGVTADPAHASQITYWVASDSCCAPECACAQVCPTHARSHAEASAALANEPSTGSPDTLTNYASTDSPDVWTNYASTDSPDVWMNDDDTNSSMDVSALSRTIPYEGTVVDAAYCIGCGACMTVCTDPTIDYIEVSASVLLANDSPHS